MKHTVDWSMGIGLALLLFVLWISVSDFITYLTKLVTIAKAFF